MLLGDGRLVFFTEFLSGWRIRSENYLGGFQILEPNFHSVGRSE